STSLSQTSPHCSTQFTIYTLIPQQPRSTLFPYTTLFRSREEAKLLTVEAENLLAIAQANGDPREITAANDALARATNAEIAITDMINSINQVQSAFTSIDNAFNTYKGSPTTANEQAIIDAGIAALAINNGVATQAATAGTNVTDTKDAIDYIHAMQLDLMKEADL